ncbi:hypothetical protein P4B35_14590 [Pontiellaceae bacterium B12227]|nr:hypothetical protein [Pontiellaceae bacterium B12227]
MNGNLQILEEIIYEGVFGQRRGNGATGGQRAECPPDVYRGWKNENDAPLEVLVIKRI